MRERFPHNLANDGFLPWCHKVPILALGYQNKHIVLMTMLGLRFCKWDLHSLQWNNFWNFIRVFTLNLGTYVFKRPGILAEFRRGIWREAADEGDDGVSICLNLWVLLLETLARCLSLGLEGGCGNFLWCYKGIQRGERILSPLSLSSKSI